MVVVLRQKEEESERGRRDYGETFGHLATLLTFGQLRLVINELADRKCPSLGEESPPRARLSRIRLLFPLANALYMQIRPTGPSACPLSRGSSARTYVCVCVCIYTCVWKCVLSRIRAELVRACVYARELARARALACSPALYK